MAGVKGQKSGGFGGRKKIENKRSINMTFRVTEEEKEIINKAKGDKSLANYILELAQISLKK